MKNNDNFFVDESIGEYKLVFLEDSKVYDVLVSLIKVCDKYKLNIKTILLDLNFSVLD